MSVTLLEVLAAARARRSSLVAETIGYLVLGVADQVVDAPRHIAADAVLVGEDGAVYIRSSAACSSTETEADLRFLLGELLAASRSLAGPLGRLATREQPAGVRGLVTALEAALVPINRAAGRRALGRLHRDTQRAIAEGHVDVSSSEPAGSGEPDSPAPSAEPDALPDPVLEVAWTELDDDLDAALYTEPPTVKLCHCTLPLPLVAAQEQDHTQPLPPARPCSTEDAAEPHTAPLRSASEPEPAAAASQPLEPVLLQDDERQPLAEDSGNDSESSMDLGDYVAAVTALQAPRPDFEPVPVRRRTFPWSGAQADLAEVPDAAEQGEWAELEELEKSAPPPLAWLDGRHGEASSTPTGVVEGLLADFDGDQERLRLALELLGQTASEASAEDLECEIDFGLGAELDLTRQASRPPAPPPDPAALWRAPRVFEPVESDVDDLVRHFSVSAVRSHPDLCRYLTEIAGLDRTPPPPPLAGYPILPVGTPARAR